MKKEGTFKDNTDGTIKNVYKWDNKIIEFAPCSFNFLDSCSNL